MSKYLVKAAYTDREDGSVHLAGEAVELSEARAAELSQKGFVGALKAPEGGAAAAQADAPEEAPEAEAEPAPAGFDPEADEPPTEAQTVAQVRAFAKAHGIDLVGLKTKADMLRAVTAELGA